MREVRRKQMEALIAKQQTLSMEALCEAFGVSMNTVRADVAYLVKTGAVQKVYGGVRAVSHQEVPLFTQRATQHPDAKRQIARRAEALVQDGDVIYIDAGTTTMHLMDFLDSAKHITVLTGNLSAIAQASAKANVELILLPGVLNRRTNSVVDGSTLEFLTRYQCSKAFMGVSGVSEDGRLCVSTYAEYELKKLAVQRSQMAYLLVDSSKFGGAGLMSYGTLADMTQIITDSGCPDGIRQLCAAKDIDLTVLPEPNRKENVHV